MRDGNSWSLAGLPDHSVNGGQAGALEYENCTANALVRCVWVEEDNAAALWRAYTNRQELVARNSFAFNSNSTGLAVSLDIHNQRR